MKLLLVGGGGREAAILAQLKKNPRITQCYCAPGNAGLAEQADLLAMDACDLDGICAFCQKEAIDLVFVAPDDPLALGLIDRLEALRIPCFGPVAAAARLEASKSYAKDFMRRHGIPTAAFARFDDYQAALDYLSTAALPLVVKADGLALGKGVFVCQTRAEAESALRSLMVEENFGRAGNVVLIEECLSGPELTVMAFSDGQSYQLMPNSRDHKRALDGDQGLNTGGMGVICPGMDFTEEEAAELDRRIFAPTFAALRKEGIPYKGVLYFGLMFTQDGPKVIEYNARFGDPEAEAVLPLLETDFLTIVEAIREGRLSELDIRWKEEKSCCVMLASGGYPGNYRKGLPISGIAEAKAAGAEVYHACTKRGSDGRILTAGGRVLAVVATAKTLKQAQQSAYAAAAKISFPDLHYRRDIGGLGYLDVMEDA